ncbi:hypothetical protein [Anaerotignum sp.]|uniref:hypothetical protein n=1 Tax=Anaerotignum sp. TaxID=2039241 RepID=UPI0028AB8712|nr:hypothetical protein [Anaerotignum sp.]
MNWIIENWYLLVALFAVLCVVGVAIYHFAKQPSQKQIELVKEWLLFACIEAEKELGGETGQYKLLYVYDLFVARFPSVAKLIPFSVFSSWVDSALEEMKKLLSENEAVKGIVVGGK